MLKKGNVQFITRTAVLLALAVAVQMAGRAIPAPANSYIVGPLVNACLLVSGAFVGLGSGIIIAILTPFTSLINNHAALAPILFLFSPFIAAGNALLVLGFYTLRRKNQIAGILTGAILKFAFLFGAIRVFVDIKDGIKPKQETALVTLFSIPQLITALIGGALAFAVIKALQNTTELK